MNRFHVHLNVNDLDASIRFYTQLFASEPSVRKDDYAKWMLDDPRLNFAISNTGRAPGIDHLGFQADAGEGLQELGRRLDAAGGSVLPEVGATCCYARSDKFWTEDPQGTKWETFHTFGESTRYHGGSGACDSGAAACSPSPVEQPAVQQPAVAERCAPRSGCC
ncbi:ArsI/CadI family heavy metal resistance metalloenzyme [Pseudomarimonas salicorniae]|uniref:VOC family protein n=1 Tax=Pseudomarimonas salicorniae TaxID=2933270 RepID=A0ABT0GGS2_9GAMM|nr:ArsI/CadI family heavy metal resistance metalloenzyme [Lysobacter sp. CAU 1642]MCK7593740.1 VOC family protein [Lysobacter sp. CAU 1642]